MSTLLDRTVAKALDKVRPPPRLPLSQWIEGGKKKGLCLPEGLVADPGPVRLWAFQREIADAIGDPTIPRVTVKKCVRVGYTTILVGAIAGHVVNEPAPIMVLLPADDSCRDFVVSDLEPIFDSSPVVAKLLSTEADETGRNNMMYRRFPGGSLKIKAARSPRNLRAHTVRVLLIDEEDAIEVTAEGDALTLAINRTLTFPNRKIVRGSTPKDEDTSTICREYDASDRRIYEMRCVECGEFSEPKWSHMEWDKEKDAQGRTIRHLTETAKWACPKCGVCIPERRKAEMVANGRWRALRPEVKGHAGFALSALISPHVNASWAELAAEYVAASGQPDLLRAFHNTKLGEGWSESVDQTTADALADRVEAFGLNIEVPDPDAPGGKRMLTIPEAVLLLTAGVDVQPDRLEISIYGWDRDSVAYALGHFIIWGNTNEGHAWRELWSAPIEVVRSLVWLLSLEDGQDGKAPEARGDRCQATAG
ncbi:terminase gpA endonuclease subunit, partial [Methylobacterium sp. Leaf100]|uniref:terminase gpA endonuclease subunit n=1 Tax=Methylobacterium sp. Leaf100 TaxID=1736252 RepID=UPI0006F3EF88